MVSELENSAVKVQQQLRINVFYNKKIVGEYFADLVVDDLIIVELKVSDVISGEHEVQLINYLKATDKEVGLLLNFGKKPGFKRKIFTNKPRKEDL